MFLEILNTLLKVLAVFSVLIVAFGLAFFILLNQGGHLSFSNIPMSLIRTFSMMLGEIDFLQTFVFPYFGESSLRNLSIVFPNTTFFMLVLFMILMPILLMNLLIGLAVGDIEIVRKNAQLKRVAKQVELHTELENKLPSCLISRVNKEELMDYPNRLQYKSFILRMFCGCWSNFGDRSNYQDSPESAPEDYLWDELECHNRRLKDLRVQMHLQTSLLKLIMQKMDINHEADENDEGVCLQDILNPIKTSRQLASATAASRRALGLIKAPEKIS